MSISIATKGRLWPAHGGMVIREQFTSIVVDIADPYEVTLSMEDVASITSEVEESPEISVSVSVLDSVTEDIEAEVDIESTVEDC